MRLFELADRPYEFSFIKRDEYSFTASFFTQSKRRFIVSAYQDDDVAIGLDGVPIILFYGEGSDDRRSLYDMQGTGDQYKILATVVAVINDWIRHTHPETFAFSASSDEPSRVKLYRRVLSKAVFPGYTASTLFEPESYSEYYVFKVNRDQL
jgi:hypothetical protein